jgi:hypothetical protein
MLFFAFLLIKDATSVKALDGWASKVVAERAQAAALGPAWLPEGWPRKNGVSTLFEPMEHAYNNVRDSDRLRFFRPPCSGLSRVTSARAALQRETHSLPLLHLLHAHTHTHTEELSPTTKVENVPWTPRGYTLVLASFAPRRAALRGPGLAP